MRERWKDETPIGRGIYIHRKRERDRERKTIGEEGKRDKKREREG